MIQKFLRSLAGDILQRPELLRLLTETRIEEARELTKDTKVDDSQSLPDEVTL